MTEHSVASFRNGFTVQGERRRGGFLRNVRRGKTTFLLKAEFQNTNFGSLPISVSTQILAYYFLILS